MTSFWKKSVEQYGRAARCRALTRLRTDPLQWICADSHWRPAFLVFRRRNLEELQLSCTLPAGFVGRGHFSCVSCQLFCGALETVYWNSLKHYRRELNEFHAPTSPQNIYCSSRWFVQTGFVLGNNQRLFCSLRTSLESIPHIYALCLR